MIQNIMYEYGIITFCFFTTTYLVTRVSLIYIYDEFIYHNPINQNHAVKFEINVPLERHISISLCQSSEK